jgi:hypothetical protein
MCKDGTDLMTFGQNVLISGLSLPSRRDEPKSCFSDASKHHRKNQTEEISSRYLCHVRKFIIKMESHASTINLRHVRKFIKIASQISYMYLSNE